MFSFSPHREVYAGIRRFAIDKHCARTALSNFAAALHAGQSKPVTQGIKQSLAFIQCNLNRFSIDIKPNHFEHAHPSFARLTASRTARRVSSPAICNRNSADARQLERGVIRAAPVPPAPYTAFHPGSVLWQWLPSLYSELAWGLQHRTPAAGHPRCVCARVKGADIRVLHEYNVNFVLGNPGCGGGHWVNMVSAPCPISVAPFEAVPIHPD